MKFKKNDMNVNIVCQPFGEKKICMDSFSNKKEINTKYT